MADTVLSCTVDGNSSIINGCNGDWNTTSKNGCTRKLNTPVRIPLGYHWNVSVQCFGEQCGAAAAAAQVTWWCWPDNR